MNMNTAAARSFITGACALVLLLSIPESTQAQIQTAFAVNVVGFQKVTGQSNSFTLISNPFTKESNDVNSVIGPQLTSGSLETSDLLYFWNGLAYETVFLFPPSASPLSNKWVDADMFQIATNILSASDGVFVKSQQESNQVVVISGDVIDDDVIATTIQPGLDLISVPFSAPIALNSTTLSHVANPGLVDIGDNIFTYVTSNQSYKTFFFIGPVANPALSNKWIDADTLQAANVILNPQEGFFYRNRGSNPVIWVESRPYPFP